MSVVGGISPPTPTPEASSSCRNLGMLTFAARALSRPSRRLLHLARP